ncbi:DUF222 domain-containing protein [Herbihabitans rhizosphaerae]|uniref:DUF222 domain-containing protein n=1 Tax=Herbihabitans rhizosphaerae TaxID=1872711 RepID=UPI00102B8EBC|nr:DUF222 domain-containing protein [Herbihabitans rhizosphaerae]
MFVIGEEKSWDEVLATAPRVFGEPEFDFSDGPFTPDEASTVAELEIVQRDKAALCADEVRLLAQYNQLRAGAENVSEEIGQALRWSPGHASHQVVMAEALVTRLPQTLAALAQGEIDWAKARAMYEVTRPLSDEHAAQVEAGVLVDAPDFYKNFRDKATRWVKKVDPTAPSNAGWCAARIGVSPSSWRMTGRPSSVFGDWWSSCIRRMCGLTSTRGG